MKLIKFGLLGALLLTTPLLSACDPVTTQAAVQDKVQAVKDWTKFGCGFVPITSTVVGLFNSGIGSSIEAIGKVICKAIEVAPLADGPGAVVSVGKVRIKGTFVTSGRKI